MARLIACLAIAATLCAQPQRIVSTAPSVTETLFALDLGDRVVGVSRHCHYPPEASTRTHVGTYLRPNVEAIIALRPDLVVLQEEAGNVAAQLERVKLRVVKLTHGDVERSLAGMQTIADACGVADRGRRLTTSIRAQLAAIRQRTSKLPQRSLVFVVGRSPGSLENLTAVGKGSYLNELIEIAGGRNALAGSLLPYPKISLESVLGLNPDVLIDMGDMAETTGVTEEHKRNVVNLWKQRTPMKSRVFAVASDIFVVPGPRMIDAAEAFAKMLHPEAR